MNNHNWLKSKEQAIARLAESPIAVEVSPQPESQPELQPESLEMRVLTLLTNEPMSKSGLSSKLGQKEISGQLNRVIRLLLADKIVEYTISDKPNSRLQKYRLSAKGKALLEKLGGRK